MYEYIEGTLDSVGDGYCVIDCQGVGYKLAISAGSEQDFCPPGQRLRLYAHFAIRENFQGLYGFATRLEREVFELLCTVSSIGPKTALGILGALSLEALADAISRSDIPSLAKAPGIGKKTAERLIVELKDKFPVIARAKPVLAAPEAQLEKDALSALMNLGYSQQVALAAISRCIQKKKDEAAPLTLSAIIRDSLTDTQRK